VAERVRAGVIAGWRNRVRHLEGHRLVEMNGLLLALTNLPMEELNVALVERRPDDALEALALAEQWFRWHGRRFGIEVELGRHPDVDRAITMLGLDLEVEHPAMAMRVADVGSSDGPENLEVRRVRTLEDLRAAVIVNVEAFGMAPEVAERYLGPTILSVPQTRVYVAELDGRPVAGASTDVHQGAVGLFGVGVLERYRSRGIGTAITLFALHDVQGEADLAWLHPTEMGRGMYERMGFRRVSDWAVFVRRKAWF
jgi:ribosomal protein S18 acetylase RimI-like enzyme